MVFLTSYKLKRTFFINGSDKEVRRTVENGVFINDLFVRKISKGPVVDLKKLRENEVMLEEFREEKNLTKSDIILKFVNENKNILNRID